MSAAAAALLTAAGAAAQPAESSAAQTVESAQEFLRLSLPGHQYLSGSIFEIMDDATRQTGVRINIIGRGRILQYQPSGRCKQTTSYDYSHITLSGSDGYRAPLPNAGVSNGVADFAQLTEAKAVGTDVHLSWKGNGRASVVYLNSESMANRAAYAFEFLRQNCDPAAGTGF